MYADWPIISSESKLLINFTINEFKGISIGQGKESTLHSNFC